MFFDGNDFDFGMPIVMDKANDPDLKIVSSKEGFLRGNMFADLYDPYKGMTYMQINPKNERERLLYKIMEVDFAINDLNLYLDLYPEDEKIYEKFKMYTDECIKLKDEYSKKFGPLTLDGVNIGTTNFNWNNSPWPWEGTK